VKAQGLVPESRSIAAQFAIEMVGSPNTHAHDQSRVDIYSLNSPREEFGRRPRGRS